MQHCAVKTFRNHRARPAPKPPQIRQAVVPLRPQRKTGCSCGGGCPACMAREIAGPDHPAEREAEAVAARVMSMPTPQAAAPLQRMAEDIPMRQPEEEAEETLQLQAEEEEELIQPRAEPGGASAPRANPMAGLGSGRPLPAPLRSFFEPRFGRSFADVRIHDGATAGARARDVHAQAFTYGRNIVFNQGRFSPDSHAGRRLIAHELTHTVQQSRGAPEIRRFVSCTRARMSLEECPERKSPEARDSRREPMIVVYLDSPVEGFLVAKFGVGQSSVKSSAKKHPNWAHLINAMSNPSSQWKLLGLSDCHGDDKLNTLLRQDRADAIHAALPSAANTRVISTGAVPLHDCITDNTTPLDRALNRSVLIALESRDASFKPEIIKGTRPVPQPQPQPTVACSTAKKLEIAQAHPIAVAMVKKALSLLAQPQTPAIESLLQKYFNDASSSTYIHVIAGLKKTLSGLKSSVKIECENIGSPSYDKVCSSSKTDVTIAYVRTRRGLFAFRVHLCEAAFGRSDLHLAATLVHEINHMFDHTTDNEYCAMGCSSSLSRWDAYDNADSYSGFAKEAYLTL